MSPSQADLEAKCREYLEDPGHCPVCGHEDISGDHIDISGDHATQECSCPEGHSWIDIYKMVAIEQVMDENDNDLLDECSKPNYEEIFGEILKKKELLPTLLGIHPEIDKLIEEALK
jgi:hypothetical protein